MKTIQIRNVPDELHRSLKTRAAREGRTLSDLILSDLPRLADGEVVAMCGPFRRSLLAACPERDRPAQAAS